MKRFVPRNLDPASRLGEILFGLSQLASGSVMSLIGLVLVGVAILLGG